MADETVSIRLRLSGGKEVRTEAKLVNSELKGIGKTSKTAAKESERHLGKIPRVLDKIKRGWSAMRTGAKYALAGAGAAGLAFLAWGKGAIKSTSDLAKATSGLVKNANFSYENASALLSLFKVRGAEPNKVALGFKALATQLGNAAKGSESSIGIFRKLGFSNKDIERSLTHTGFAVNKVTQGLDALPPGLSKTAIGAKVFGKAFETIFPLLRDGPEALQENLDKAKEYGAVLDKEATEKAMNFVEAQREVALANMGLKLAFAQGVEPYLTKVLKGFAEVIKILHDPHLSVDEKAEKIEHKLHEVIDSLVPMIEKAVPMVIETSDHIGLLIAKSIVKGFIEAPLSGKLAIGFWLFHKMGGLHALGKAGGKAGKKIATAMAARMLAVFGIELAAEGGISQLLQTRFKGIGKVAGRAFMIGLFIGMALFGYWLGQKLGAMIPEKTRVGIKNAGLAMGEALINSMIWVINQGIEKINGIIDRSIDVGPIHIGGTRIGTVDPVNFERSIPNPGKPPNRDRFAPGYNPNATKHRPLNPRTGEVERKIFIPNPAGRRRSTVHHQPIQLMLDGRVLAETTVRVGDDEGARE